MLSRLSRLSPSVSSFVRHSSQNAGFVPKALVSQILINAKEQRKVTYQQLAEHLNVNKVWLTTVMLGQHPADEATAKRIVEALNIRADSREQLVTAMQQIPTSRGATDPNQGKDPILRRFDELIDVYGESIKSIIREEAGDGIMSAIDCKLNIDAVPQENGDVRIVVNIDGKFLKYNNNS